jgi:predicted lipid-binding transport protein (Tim44 family)
MGSSLIIGDELLGHEILSRPGWAERYTENSRRRRINSETENESTLSDDGMRDGGRKKHKQSQAAEDAVMEIASAASSFPQAPGAHATKTQQQKSQRGKGRGGHSARSLERNRRNSKE